MARGFNRAHYDVAPLKVCIADVHAKANLAGNAIDRAGKHIADANGCHRINGSASACRALDRQNHLGRRAKSIMAVGHQDTTGVSARTFNQNSQTRRCRDLRDDTERDLLTLQ